MITRKIEVKDIRELREDQNMGYSLAGFFFSLPWCCITPALLSLFGFFGAVGATRGFLLEVFYPLFLISVLLLGRANYLSFYKKRGSRVSRALVLISTAFALILWAFRFGLITV